MESHRFDDLARAFGVARSRRQIVRALSVSVSSLVGIQGVRTARASGDSGAPDGGQAGCLDAGAGCTTGSECCNGFCVNGACGDCAVNTDCPGADVCDEGTCTPALCTDGAGCGLNQVCCGGVCYMGECCDDTDCAGASFCIDDGSGVAICEITICDTELDCTGVQLCCGGVCQADFCCTTDEECEIGSLCCDGACLPCPDGGVCGTSGGSAVCTCPGGQIECLDGCAACCEDTDCDSDEVCVEGDCAFSCTTDTDCGGNESCIGGACLCDSGFMRCGGSCVECCTYLDCPGAEICEAGICVPLCLEGGDACVDDADCCSGLCDASVCDELVTALPETGTGPDQ